MIFEKKDNGNVVVTDKQGFKMSYAPDQNVLPHPTLKDFIVITKSSQVGSFSGDFTIKWSDISTPTVTSRADAIQKLSQGFFFNFLSVPSLVIVDDITERDNLDEQEDPYFCLVLDATDDPKVDEGGALYIWNPDTTPPLWKRLIEYKKLAFHGLLIGTHYIFVQANGTAEENAQELQDAYDKAKNLTPNGNPLSSENRVTILVGKGEFDFSTDFVVDAEFVDIVSLERGLQAIEISGGLQQPIRFTGTGTIDVQENDVKLYGIDVGNKPFKITGDNLTDLVIECCKGGDDSFGNNIAILSGTFKDIVAGNTSFLGGFSNLSGPPFVSGHFENIIVGSTSFGFYGAGGGSGGDVNGILKSCIGEFACFGTDVGISGDLHYCIGGMSSFAGSSSITGNLYHCKLTSGTYITPTGTGKIILSLDEDNNIVDTTTSLQSDLEQTDITKQNYIKNRHLLSMSGIKNYVESGETLHVRENHEYNVFSLTNDGTIINDGEINFL